MIDNPLKFIYEYFYAILLCDDRDGRFDIRLLKLPKIAHPYYVETKLLFEI